MTYTIDLHKHVKIWLSPDVDVFLPAKNQVRLIEMRQLNPQDTIHFFYDSKLLSRKAQDELHIFCAKYNILPKDLRNTVFLDNNPTNLKTISCYDQEIEHLHEGGNLGAASDIARLFTYHFGNYSDFDVIVNTNKLPPTITIDKPVLFNLGSAYGISTKIDAETLWFNGDVILTSDSQETEAMMKKLRAGVYESYTQDAFSLKIANYQRELQQLCTKPELKGTSWQKLYEQCDLQFITMLASFRSKKALFPWQLRGLISKLTETQVTHAEAVKHNLLMQSVICTTGAELGLRCIFNKGFYTKSDLDIEVKPYSLIQHGLDKAFYSKNSAPFHMKDDAFMTKEGGDLSWTQIGKDKFDKENKALEAPKGIAPLFNGTVKQQTEKTLTDLTATALEDFPTAKWTYYAAKEGEKSRPKQVWLSVNSKQVAEDVKQYLTQHEVKKLEISKSQGTPVLIVIEPDLAILRTLPVMPKVVYPLEEKSPDVSAG